MPNFAGINLHVVKLILNDAEVSEFSVSSTFVHSIVWGYLTIVTHSDGLADVLRSLMNFITVE